MLPLGWLLSLVVGCDGAPEDSGTEPAPSCPPDSAVSWESFGRPTITTWCTPCHSASLPLEARQGAPLGLDFDTYEQVAAMAPQIDASAGQGDRMPPGGGLSATERALLHEWVACGAPGEPTSPPVSECGEPRVREGDLTAPEPDFCERFDAVGGSLAVASTDGLDCLCDIGGDLVLTGMSGEASLPRLRRVGGSVVAAGSGPTSLELAALETVGGDLAIEGVVPLERVWLNALETVGGAVVLAGDPALGLVSLPRLVDIGGELRIADNAAMLDIAGTRSLRSIGGGVSFVDNPSVTALDILQGVRSVGGDIEIARHPALTELRGLSDLAALDGQVRIEEDAALSRLAILPAAQRLGGMTLRELPSLAEIVPFAALESLGPAYGGEGLVVSGLGALSAFEAFPVLAQIDGSFRLIDNDGLVVLAELGALRTVEGDLELSGHEQLEDVSALEGLVRVGGDLRVVDNPALPAAAVDALVSAIDEIGGTVTATGNGP